MILTQEDMEYKEPTWNESLSKKPLSQSFVLLGFGRPANSQRGSYGARPGMKPTTLSMGSTGSRIGNGDSLVYRR